MLSRRLIAAPVVAFVATVLVAAVIDTGQRTRAEAVGGPVRAITDPDVRAELSRIDDAMRAEARCVGRVECDESRAGSRVRSAASDIERWPVDSRFQGARQALANQLDARAAVLDQRAMAARDGRTSPAEAKRLDALTDAWRSARRATADAQLASGLIDRAEHRQVLADLIRGDGS